jgi:hypothetical protein
MNSLQSYTSSQIPINIDRYTSTLYYETMIIYSSELSELHENNFFSNYNVKPGEASTISGLSQDIDKCIKNPRPTSCPTITTAINDVFENPLITKNPTNATNQDISKIKPIINQKKQTDIQNITLDSLGLDIISKIIFKKLFENSLNYLLNNKQNTLFIFPKLNIDLNFDITSSPIVKTFYNNLKNNSISFPNYNIIDFIDIFPDNPDDDINVYTDKLNRDISRIQERIKTLAYKEPRGKDANNVIKNIIYFVDKDNNFFIDYFKSTLNKKYVDALNTVINKLYSTNKIGQQELKKFSTITINLAKTDKNLIIKELNNRISTGYKDHIKKIIIDKQFLNNIAILLNKLDLCYQIRLDKSNKKKLSSSSNSDIFNIFMRFNNIDSPIITDELIANQNVLYAVKSKNKTKIGYFTLVNESKRQYRFNLALYENKQYKDIKSQEEEQKSKKNPKKEKSEKKSEEEKAEEEEEKILLDQADDLLLQGKNTSNIETKTTLYEIRYIYGQIQYKDIEKNLYAGWNSDNIIIFYKTINSYEIYKFFNHRMLDLSFKDNIDIKYFKNTLYDKKSLIEFLKEEKKYNDKTRLGFEFINININNDLLIKYNNFIYDKFKNNIDMSVSANDLFIEKIKKSIVEIIFENNSLVYIKETNKIKNAPKEQATSDNYKITNYRYTSIPNKNMKETIIEYFKNYNEVKHLKCSGIKNCIQNKESGELELPSELNDKIKKGTKKTLGLAIVNITKELDKDSSGLLFASECKGKKQNLKQSYYDLVRMLKGDKELLGGKNKTKNKKNKKTRKYIKRRRIYSLKYPKAY